MSVSASLSISHPFLVLQVYVPQGSSIGVELTIRDNLNTKRRLVLCEGLREIASSNVQVRIPNGIVLCGNWLNLCIDMNSFLQDIKQTAGTP